LQDSRLVIFAHGSLDIRWRLPFEELTASLIKDHGADKVRLAYMEFAHPSLADVVREAARDGKLNLRILPLFLAAGAHVAEDIPRQITDAQGDFPEIKIELLKPIGEHPRVKELFREIACDYVRD
jgi:sirohydrochlorin cobaltochelatase